jgi:hypothetical protein
MMKLIGAGAAVLVLTFGGGPQPAQARPPTVTNSPGYEARLAESRKALAGSHAVQQPGKDVTRRTRKPKHPAHD